MSKRGTFQKIPVDITAQQFTGWADANEISAWSGAFYVPRGYEHRLRKPTEHDRSNGHILDDAPEFLVIRTLEGDMRADLRDWIIEGVQGEFYPCKPDIFQATYEALTSDG